ncbi:MAG: hypothetical protein Q4A58_03100 [Fusobacterium sp.]|uniref:hypothetical protein n=1 Tax=Fusobacterium sp. TaxID=68766 RepID=UPI0026DADEBD|nr:hypothetical protein [Fusobacterium sp.]MDO4690265.1 hypothetical protein [Fusobacterium sp.]
MKKILMLILFSLSFFNSCKKEVKESISIYTDKNLIILTNDIIKSYEKENRNVKINILNEKPKNLKSLDIIISSDENFFTTIEETEKISYKDDFHESFFADDTILLIGRRKLNSLNDLLYSHIACPNYESKVGKIFIDNISNLDFFKEISKNIEYVDDAISAMQSVDLYESDYAVINSLLLSSTKNTEICFTLSTIDEKGESTDEKIVYNSYVKKETSENVKNFYAFLHSKKVEKLIEEHRKR